MKIFKLFISLSLILSVSLINSLAAISVSDGSAFVTKAEFAADLNNLSNRMSSLENSLDAKIDSLVSSYLSRNGIWNGEKQEIANYWVISNNQVDNEIPKPSDNITSQVGVRVADKVFKASKSGLLFAKYGILASNAYRESKGNSIYVYFLSTSIAPFGSKWLGDYDGFAENSIAYFYPYRYAINGYQHMHYKFDLNGFVDKGVEYSIYISMYPSSNISSSMTIKAYYSTSYRGFLPEFNIY